MNLLSRSCLFLLQLQVWVSFAGVSLTLTDNNSTNNVEVPQTFVNSTTRNTNNTVSSSCLNTLPPGTHTVEVTSGGSKRTFDLYVPTGLTDNDPRPVVFFWHGYGGNPKKIEEFAHPNEMADKYRYLVVYPKGTGILPGFNGAGCCPLIFADDVAFFREMTSWAGRNMCGDISNIFSAGFSNGGFMTNRLACEASDVVKGIAVHSGSMNKGWSCNPTKGMPTLLIHGDADPTVPYFGNGDWKSFGELAQKWSDLNQCGSESNAVPGYTSEKTECVRYDSCSRDNVPLEFCTVKEMGHTWSGDGDYQIDATSYIFKFFDALV